MKKFKKSVYQQKIEEIDKESKELWEQITKTPFVENGFAVDFGTWKTASGHDFNLRIFTTINPKTKLYEILPTTEMLDEKCTFDTFRANNIHLNVFGIRNEKRFCMNAKYNQLQNARNQYVKLEQRRQEEEKQRLQRIAEIKSELSKEDRLQKELEELEAKQND